MSTVTAMPVRGSESVLSCASRSRGPIAFSPAFEVCQLNEQKGEVTFFPEGTPTGDHRREQRLVFGHRRASGIVLTLIPDDAFDGVGNQGGDHAVEKEGRVAPFSRGSGRLRHGRFRRSRQRLPGGFRALGIRREGLEGFLISGVGFQGVVPLPSSSLRTLPTSRGTRRRRRGYCATIFSTSAA